jgi:hypothetical protein
MAWEGHVTRMGVMNNADSILVEISKGTKPVFRLGADGETILSRVRGLRD